ncbi:MAG: alanine racemase [Parcubacteria group bacterium]|nr:alanine racemase [Parcubacteria group bacterium]
MNLLSLLRDFKRSFSSYRPLVEVLIYRERLLYNLREFERRYPKLAIAPVLKSNAYGHGLSTIARILDGEDLPFLIVDSLFEARLLRHEGIRTPILVIGYTTIENIHRSNLRNIAFTITGFTQLEAVADSLPRPTMFHLKIDTGMHRQGIMPSEVTQAVHLLKQNRQLKLEGVFSHFADADSPDSAFTLKQIERWHEMVSLFKKEFSTIRYYHLSATAGMRYADRIEANMARIGRGLYGIDPVGTSDFELQPVLEMKTIVSAVKELAARDYVGYGLTFRAEKPMKIAVVSVGYFEGVDRRLSNRGVFKIHDQFCPIVGRVSMNITTVNVSSLPDVKEGDEVTVISKEREDPNSIESIAKICDTIPHEILVHIPQHLRRTVV